MSIQNNLSKESLTLYQKIHQQDIEFEKKGKSHSLAQLEDSVALNKIAKQLEQLAFSMENAEKPYDDSNMHRK